MNLLSSPHELFAWRKTIDPKSVGFVPTMGALHQGHVALLQKAKSENDLVVLSIFVNPTQFNDKSDLEKYPRTLEADLEVARQENVAVTFYPDFEQMYPDSYHFKLVEDQFSKLLCGKDRPGHFDGVLSVVMKLLQLVRPNKSYFGEKDFQQLRLIQQMHQAFFLPGEIVGVSTVREKDGLAMSSRNQRLTADQREKAPLIYQTITSAGSALDAKRTLEKAGFKVDYVQDLDGRRFVAAKLGSVRLIDNVQI